LLYFGDGGGFLRAEDVEINVVAAATKPAGTAQGITLAVDAEDAMAVDNFALTSIADATLTGAAHGLGSLARSSIASNARTGTRTSLPILIVGRSPLAAASRSHCGISRNISYQPRAL